MFFLTNVATHFQVLSATFIEYRQNVNKHDIYFSQNSSDKAILGKIHWIYLTYVADDGKGQWHDGTLVWSFKFMWLYCAMSTAHLTTTFHQNKSIRVFFFKVAFILRPFSHSIFIEAVLTVKNFMFYSILSVNSGGSCLFLYWKQM